MANIQKKFKDAKDVFDAGQENSLLDKGLSLLVPAVLGFSVAHSVWGISNERDYAVTQCVVSVAGLGYCLKKRYEVEHKKTGKILNIGVCNRYHKSVDNAQGSNERIDN